MPSLRSGHYSLGPSGLKNPVETVDVAYNLFRIMLSNQSSKKNRATVQLATAMDSYEDATKQLSSYSHLSRQTEDFCENPSCLGKVWHDWGCCSTGSTTSTSATIASATTAEREPSTETVLDDPGWGGA